MTEKNLESVFKEALGKFEADVNPSLWQSVQSGLAAKGAAVSGASGSVQAGQVITGLGVKGMVWIASAVLVSGAGLYMIFGGDADKPVTAAKPKTEVLGAPVVETPVVQAPASQVPVNEKPEIQSAKPNVKQPLATHHSGTSDSKPIQEIQVNEPPVSSPAKTRDNHKSGETTAPANTKSELATKPAEAELPSAGTNTAASQPDVTESDNPTFTQIEDYLLADHTGHAMLPNAFTPNGDGNNDEFSLQTKGLQSLEVTVFQLNGDQVYHWNGLQGHWNGLLANGKEAPAGKYLYSVKAITLEGKICIAQSTLFLKK